jgi:hypothetical protein
MPVDASDEPLALRPDLVPASGAVVANAAAPRRSVSGGPPSHPPPSIASSSSSSSGAAGGPPSGPAPSGPHFVLPPPPALPSSLPSTPFWSVDLLLQGHGPVHRTDLDYLIIDIGTPEPVRACLSIATLCCRCQI